MFASGLGLTAPWRVAKVELNTAQKRIDFKLMCDAKQLPCPLCHKSGKPIHDRRERQWRQLDFVQFEVWLQAVVPRIACSGCGKTTQMAVPCAREGSGFTALFEALALSLCKDNQCVKLTQMLRYRDKQLWRGIEHYVEINLANSMTFRMYDCGINETSSRKVHDYITGYTTCKNASLLWLRRQGLHNTKKINDDLKAHGGKPVQFAHVCQDMHAACVKGVGG